MSVFSRNSTADKAEAAFSETAGRMASEKRARKGLPSAGKMRERYKTVFAAFDETIEAIDVIKPYLRPAPAEKRRKLNETQQALRDEKDRINGSIAELLKRSLAVHEAMMDCARAMRSVDRHIDKAPFRPLMHFRSQRALLESELSHITEPPG
jgi:uncharacterized sporulation protein YeaH/YhbH (DUF444 family)